LAVASLAFAAWIGYLIYLTQTADRPSIVLSRPQFLYVECAVIAHLDNKDGPATVKEVVFGQKDKVHVGDSIEVKNLRDSFRKRLGDANASEWDVPNDFILPLQDLNGKGGKWTAEVVPLPPSPGLPHGTLIYPVTPDTLEQLHAIVSRLPKG
jgi:hypothetical protein